MGTVKLVAVACLVVGCGDSGITPEQTTSSSSSGTGAGAHGGGGSDGTGGAGGASNEGGRGPMPALGYENGSRLRARVFVGDDGSRQFLGWRDTELEIDCAFQKSPNGVYRCLPSGAASVSASFFTGPSCSTGAILATCGAAPSYALENVGSSCDPAYVVHEVGPSLSNLYVLNGAQCNAIGIPDGFTAYADGGSMQSSVFAAATVAVE